MLILERGYSPGAVWPELWAEVDASVIIIEAWPNREIGLRVEDSAGVEIFTLEHPEPGMALYVEADPETPRRVRLFTREVMHLLSACNCRVRVLTTPRILAPQIKQEAQGMSLTRGTPVTCPTAAVTRLGEFTAWRSGLLRVAGDVSANPATLAFSLYSIYATGGLTSHLVASTGNIPHGKLPFEFSLRSGAATFLVPAVIAGRMYALYLRHGAAGDVDVELDVYIEPVALN